MFERLLKTQIATVSEIDRRNRIVDALSAAGIPCCCKTRDVNQRTVFDQRRFGTLGIKPKYVTEIFVDRQNAEMALHILRTL